MTFFGRQKEKVTLKKQIIQGGNGDLGEVSFFT